MTPTLTSDASWDLAPAWALTAVREKPPVTGNAWKSEPAMFASPSALSSWSASMSYRFRDA